MVERAQIETFWRSWRPGSPDDSAEFEKLRNRVCTVVKNNVWPQIWSNPQFWGEFVVLSGASYYYQDSNLNFTDSAIYLYICKAESLVELMQGVQSLLWALHKTSPSIRDVAVRRLNSVFEMSPDVIAHVAVTAEGPTLYPGGAKIWMML